MTGLVVLLAVLAASTAAGLLMRARAGRFRSVPGAASPVRASDRPAERVDAGLGDVLARLGHVPGERATLLQFSSAFCAPCRATRRVLGEVAELVPGVRHVEVDAEQHLDVVRLLGIARTPTTLVLDAEGRVSARATGLPRKAEVLSALGNAVP